MRLFLAIGLLCCITVPSYAQSVEELQAELEAQKQLNELLRQRISTLEAKLEGKPEQIASVERARPVGADDDPEVELALVRSLQRRGAAVLPAGSIELTPSMLLSHSGRDALSNRDRSAGGNLDGRIGLENGWMIGASVPLLTRKVDGVGSNSGLGDVSVAVWKSLLNGADHGPSLVGSLRYTAPTGKSLADDPVPLGSGAHFVTGRMTAVQRADPIVFYGDISYAHPVSQDTQVSGIDRQGIFGIGAGASLAVTPDISANAGFDFAFEDALRIDGQDVGGDMTIGQINLGVGILMSRATLLSVSGAFGITDDSPDLTLLVSLPVRF